MVRTSAPGKCILFGEHSVVFGEPAVAVAIEQRCVVELGLSKSEYWMIDGMRYEGERHPHIEGLRNRLWLDRPELDLVINSVIPAGSGLGSSAALSVAIAAAMRCARGRRVTEEGEWREGFSAGITETDAYAVPAEGRDAGNITEGGNTLIGANAIDTDELGILGHAVEAESQAGRASPTDTSTSSLGGAVLISDERVDGMDWQYSRALSTPEGERTWQVHRVGIPASFEEVHLVIGDTGINSPTAKMVAQIAEQMSAEPSRMNEIEAMGNIARRGAAALRDGEVERLGMCMSENHLLLRGLGVSCPELETLIQAAAPHSLGVKLTGAGGGGCMIALTRDAKRCSEAIELAGGRTYISRLGCEGVRVEDDSDCPL